MKTLKRVVYLKAKKNRPMVEAFKTKLVKYWLGVYTVTWQGVRTCHTRYSIVSLHAEPTSVVFRSRCVSPSTSGAIPFPVPPMGCGWNDPLNGWQQTHTCWSGYSSPYQCPCFPWQQDATYDWNTRCRSTGSCVQCLSYWLRRHGQWRILCPRLTTWWPYLVSVQQCSPEHRNV